MARRARPASEPDLFSIDTVPNAPTPPVRPFTSATPVGSPDITPDDFERVTVLCSDDAVERLVVVVTAEARRRGLLPPEQAQKTTPPAVGSFSKGGPNTWLKALPQDGLAPFVRQARPGSSSTRSPESLVCPWRQSDGSLPAELDRDLEFIVRSWPAHDRCCSPASLASFCQRAVRPSRVGVGVGYVDAARSEMPPASKDDLPSVVITGMNHNVEDVKGMEIGRRDPEHKTPTT